MFDDSTTMQQGLINLNRSLALERIGGDEELLKEIAVLFLDDYPNLIADIREACRSRNARSLERAAHTLKGSISNFGAERAQNAALELEMIGRNGAIQDAPAALGRLESAMTALLPEMQALARQ